MATASAQEPIAAAPDEQRSLCVLDDALREEHDMPPKLLTSNGEQLDLPESLLHLLKQAVHDMSQGRAVILVSRDRLLTTQEAADILNVSRPYLVKLLEENRIPYTKAGTHRRIDLEDVIAYKQKRDAERRRGLAELTQLGEEMGDYD
jgi:excisionase family DNA binding protein